MTGTADLNYSIAIVNPDGTPLAGFITQWNSLRTDVGKALDAAAAAVADTYQPHTTNLDALSSATQTTFGVSLLGEASATHLLNTTLSAYTSAQTNSAITAALSPYLLAATAASTYQPIGSYVTYTAQTLTSPQQAQARTNIGAQVAGSYPTGSGTCSGTNTGDQTITLTGDVTGSGTGSFAATIGANKVTLAQMAQVVTATFLGRTTASTGNVEAMTVSQAKALLNLTGTNSGDQTITLTGDVTGSGTGSFAATLVTAQPSAHTWAATQTFTVAPVFTDQSGTRTALGLGTLATQSGTFSGTSSGTNTGDQTITLTGDVTGSGTGSFAATIGANKVTLAQMATVATATFLGRTTAATGNVEALTVAQAKALLNLTGTNSGDQTITLTGDVTGSGTGSFAATLATAQPAVHTWALAQTFTVAPVFTDQSGSRTALGLATVASSGSASDLTTGTLPVAQTAALTGDVTKPAGSSTTTLATAQPAVHTWALAQTFTVAPVFTDKPGSRVAMNIDGRTVVLVDADYTILTTDRMLTLGVSFTANRTWTLPSVSTVNVGQSIVLVPNGGAAASRLNGFTLNVAPFAGERINRNTSALTITDPDAMIVLYSMGTNGWSAIGRGVRHSNPIRVLTTGASTTLSMSIDHTLIVRKTVGSATGVTLPAGAAGVEFIVKDGNADAAVNNITITPAAGNIDGAATYVINVNRGAVTLKYDGTEWTVVAKV